MTEKEIEVKDIDDQKDLKEFSSQNEVSIRGKRFEVGREQLPFEKLMEMATMLSSSTIIPSAYYKRPENCFVALDMASRMGLSPMIVMQNLYVIQGKPSWSGSAIGAMLKASPQFKDMELVYVGKPNTDEWGAYVTAKKVVNDQVVKGATVTIAIAKKEGWYGKSGSKWQTIPELMLAYRAYAWFGKVNAPELLMGLQSSDEVVDSDKGKSQAIDPFESEV